MTVAYESIRRAIGMGGDKLMPVVAGVEEDSPQGKKITERRKQIFKEAWLPRLRPFPGVRALIEHLNRKGFTLAVASSATEDELHSLLEVARVTDLIPTRTSSDDADRSKPDPDIVTAAIKRAGCPKDRTVMVGDTPYDVEAATRAGIQVIGLTCGGWSREDLRGTVTVYTDAADLREKYETSVFARLQGKAGSHTQ